MADQPKIRKPDALIVPAGWAGHEGVHKIQREFGALLGGRLQCRNQTSFNFITNDCKDTLLWPIGHSQEKEERYHWYVAAKGPDGTLLPTEEVQGHHDHQGRFLVGYLKPDPDARDGAAQARMAAAQDRAAQDFAARLADPQFVGELVARGILTTIEPQIVREQDTMYIGPNVEHAEAGGDVA